MTRHPPLMTLATDQMESYAEHEAAVAPAGLVRAQLNAWALVHDGTVPGGDGMRPREHARDRWAGGRPGGPSTDRSRPGATLERRGAGTPLFVGTALRTTVQRSVTPTSAGGASDPRRPGVI